MAMWYASDPAVNSPDGTIISASESNVYTNHFNLLIWLRAIL